MRFFHPFEHITPKKVHRGLSSVCLSDYFTCVLFT